MRLIVCQLLLFFFFGVLPACHRPHNGPGKNPDPVNDIGDVNAGDSEIFVRNWDITKPVIMDSGSDANAISVFADTLNRDQGDNIMSYADFSSMYDEPAGDTGRTYTPFTRYHYLLNKSYFFIDDYYHIASRKSFFEEMVPAFMYTASIIRSSRDQDVVFLAGANNGVKLWLNGQLILRQFTTGFIQGYQYVVKVHLKKGDNFLLAKLLHTDGEWKFFLKMASLRYANENSLGENYWSICDHYLIKKGDSLGLKIWAPQIPVTKPALLQITNIDGKEVLKQRLGAARNWTVPVNNLKEGAYAVTVTTDENTFQQYIFYGDYQKYFSSFRSLVERVAPGGRFRENIDLLTNRMAYIGSVNVAHDNEWERKVTRVLYQMTHMYLNYKRGNELFTDVPGLQLRSLSSQLSRFYASDNYMIYVPRSYRKNSPIPLVMMLPHETGVREFTISTYVSDINRIEHIMNLADKYGYAVVWSCFRVYNNHNLIRMFPDLVSKTLNAVRKDYTIDTTRIYAYGDCGGGELALFMANKYPSFFAAVGVEGPAIPNLGRTDSTKSRLLWDINYDLYNTAINYRNFPTCIIHSDNDEKCAYGKSVQLYREISQLGGSVTLETLHVRKGTDLFFSDLMPNNRILSRLFAFYNGRRKKIPDTVWLSTYQLKYNHAFWVTIDDLVPHEKARLMAAVNRAGNSVTVQCSHVTALTLAIADLKLDTGRKMTINVNNKVYYNGYFKGEKLTVDLHRSQLSGNRKNEFTEGPVNDFFSSPFLVVKSTKGTVQEQTKWKNAVDTLQKSWKTDFIRDTIICKADTEIAEKDAADYNLILIGTGFNNPVLNRLWDRIPLKVYKDSVLLGSKKYPGKHLSYLFVYPNPLNPHKYVLVIGSNAGAITSKVLVDISFQGWFDYEVYDREAVLETGYFNNNWQ